MMAARGADHAGDEGNVMDAVLRYEISHNQYGPNPKYAAYYFGIRDDKYRYSSMTKGDKDYFNNRKATIGWTSDPSPGEQWEPIAPKCKLGYCWTGPADNEGSAGIISSFYSKVKGGMNPIAAWGAANAGTKGNNACAIDTSVTPHQYWYFRAPLSIFGHPIGGLTWTCVTKGGSGW